MERAGFKNKAEGGLNYDLTVTNFDAECSSYRRRDTALAGTHKHRWVLVSTG